MANLVIGVDCGLQGGISILIKNELPLVYKIPLNKVVVNKKNKNTYNMESVVGIFEKYKDKKVLFVIERQNVRYGEGAVSAMTIGKGYGQLMGVAYAFHFEVIEVTPQAWKKQFPELITDDMYKIKAKIKELRAISKTLKGKGAQKENKKEIDKLGRNFKYLAKTEARYLVSKKYPELSDNFKLVSSDGLAESLLITIYGKEKYGKEKQNELV